jgi:hypothetical protein
MKLPEDIVAQLDKDFGPDAPSVKALFDAYGVSIPEPARVVRCVIFLARRDASRVPSLLEAARGDYRDVIFWAEYRDHAASHPKRLRDFSKPFLHAARKRK